MDGGRSDRRDEQLLEELLLEGLATPAKDQLRRDVREVIAQARSKL
jgi:hypothetical protein